MPDSRKQDGVPLGREGHIQRRLIRDIKRVKPEDANSLQLYNFIRELLIVEDLGIDEGLERAQLDWPLVEAPMREFYDSEPLAELLNFIPFPRSMAIRKKALQKEVSSPSCPEADKPKVKAKKPTPKSAKCTAKRANAKVQNKRKKPLVKMARKNLKCKPKMNGHRNQDNLRITLNESITRIMKKFANKQRRANKKKQTRNEIKK